MRNIKFGFTAGPVMPADQAGAAGDAQRYLEVLDDCRFGHGLGYESVWMLEHHFTDYYPSPSPLFFLGHVAAACPGLGLGTAVIVLPWYEPVRFAEDVAMLSLLSKGELYLGLGRGVARIEYDARNINMEHSRELFEEGVAITRGLLSGQPFRFEGKHYKIPREVTLRPGADLSRIHLYGACNNPGTAERMAEIDLPLLCTSASPFQQNIDAIGAWRTITGGRGGRTDVNVPLWIHCFIGDSQEEAEAEATTYLGVFFRSVIQHYEVYLDPWRGLATYENHVAMMQRFQAMADPKNMPPFAANQLIGTTDTVAERVQRYLDIGITQIAINTAQPARPLASRRNTLRRFAREVAPRFSPSFAAAAE